MENASKALIIAGAILISIILISIGVAVVNASRGLGDEAESTLSAQEKETFNANFTSYEKENTRGSTVKQLIEKVMTSNSSHPNDLVSVNIKNQGDPDDGVGYESDNLSAAKNAITNTKRYTVFCHQGSDAVIDIIYIVESGLDLPGAATA